jgi:DNA repair exonuclease SbcCD ATPase subunit
MRIKNIKASGIKGRTFDHQLAALTVICGENRAGKTTVADAVVLALAGFHPGQGKALKTNADVMSLSTAGAMTVRAEFDDGRWVSRAWKRTKTGVSRGDEWDSGLGDDWAVPPVAVDVGAYLNLSTEKRVDYVFDLCRGEVDVQASALAARIKSVRLDPHTKEAEDCLVEIAALCHEPRAAGQTAQQWIGGLGEKVAERLKLARAAEKRMSLTVQGIEQLRAEALAAGKSTPSVARRLAESRTKKEEAIRRKAEVQVEGLEARRAADRVAEIGKLVEDLNRLGDVQEAARAQQAKEAAESRALTLRMMMTPSTKDLSQAVAEQRTKFSTIEAGITTASENLRNAENRARLVVEEAERAKAEAVLDQKFKAVDKRLDVAKAAVDRYDPEALRAADLAITDARTAATYAEAERLTDAANLEGIDKRVKEVRTATCCPWCKCDGEGWKRNLLDELDAARRDAVKSMIGAVESCRVAAQAKDSADKRYFTARAESEAHRDRLAEVESLQDEARRVSDDMVRCRKRGEEIGDALAELGDTGQPAHWRQIRDELQRDAQSALKAVDDMQKRLDESLALDVERREADCAAADARAKLDAVSKCGEQAAALVDERKRLEPAAARRDSLAEAWKELDEDVTKLRNEIALLEEKDREAAAALGQQADKQRALDAALKVQGEVTAAQAAADVVAEERAALVRRVFESALLVANKIVRPTLDAVLQYRDGELGLALGKASEGFVRQSGFSGLERAVVCAALSVSLAAQSECRIAVIDEVDMSHKSFVRLLKACAEVIADRSVDQVLVVGTERPALEIEVPGGVEVKVIEIPGGAK